MKTGGWSRQRRREGKRQPDISVKGLATVLVHDANPNQVILDILTSMWFIEREV
jgi:hypothetical protein